MQHAASQQCLSKTSYTFFLPEKEIIFNAKAMVTCKRSAAVVKKLTNYEHLALSKKTSKPKLLQGFISPVLCTLLLPWKIHRIHGANYFTSNDKK